MYEFLWKFHWSVFVSRGPINNYSIIGLDNGLAPTRRQAIILTNDDYFTDAYMRQSASMS